MGKITIDELSTEFKEYINGLGLTEEQVNELIQNVTGDMNTLQTTEKTVAGAINELFQNANNGKELIATAIGEPLVSTDTFSAMSTDINNLLSTFKTNMMNSGVMVEGTDKFKQLIDKIKGLTEGEGNKGIQFAEGTCTVTNSLITHNCGFIPTYFFVLANGISLQYKLSNGSFYNSVLYNPIISNIRMFGSDASTGIVGSSSITELNESTAKISNISGDVTWYAIGVGEEDTTLRDSLASILEEEGVVVLPEDDMANLITKTDEEFDKKNNNIQTNKDKLYNLMLDGGYNVTNDMNLDDLLVLIESNGFTVKGIKQIACGYQHTMILKNDGTLWGAGLNNYGQLGLGDKNQRNVFIKITHDVKEVVCGNYHSMIIKNDGTLWGTGRNVEGQLGLGDYTDKNIFTQINSMSDVKQMVCADGEYSFILKNDGTVWASGLNTYGQLGLDTNGNKYNTFTQVTTNVSNVKFISCGYNNTIMLKNDGSIWGAGFNSCGELGLNDTNRRDSFTRITTNINNDVKEVFCGNYKTMILKNDGTVWACGSGKPSLGLGSGSSTVSVFTKVTTNVSNVKTISCGYQHTLMLKNDGTVWGTGFNNVGQLGLNSTNLVNTFTQITDVVNVKQIICGDHYSIILKNDGTVWGCGNNDYGKLGINNTNTGIDDTSEIKVFTQVPEGMDY